MDKLISQLAAMALLSDEDVIKNLTKKQKENLLTVYTNYKKTGIKHEDSRRQLGCGLKTGTTLYKKGLVRLSYFQLTDWSMWEITEKGIRIAEKQINEKGL